MVKKNQINGEKTSIFAVTFAVVNLLKELKNFIKIIRKKIPTILDAIMQLLVMKCTMSSV